MPVLKCPNGKYRIGSGKCMYDSKEKAERAYKGYLGSKHGGKKFVVAPGGVHTPVAMPDLSIRGWGKKKKKYSFTVYKTENVK